MGQEGEVGDPELLGGAWPTRMFQCNKPRWVLPMGLKQEPEIHKAGVYQTSKLMTRVRRERGEEKGEGGEGGGLLGEVAGLLVETG